MANNMQYDDISDPLRSIRRNLPSLIIVGLLRFNLDYKNVSHPGTR